MAAKNLKKLHKWICMCVMFVSVMAFSINTFAAVDVEIDTGKKVTLTVQSEIDEKPVEGVNYKLYLVAKATKTGKFNKTGVFNAYAVEVNGLDTEGLNDAAVTLASYVNRDNVKPMIQQETNSEGIVVFQSEKMVPGLYLLMADEMDEGSYTYSPASVLISIPGFKTDGTALYDPIVKPKYETHDKESSVTRKVLKRWVNDDAKKRPESVVVQLLKGSEVYDEVTLSEENNWRYTWEELEAGNSWSVVEKEVPKGYKVSVSKDGITFVVTNTVPSKDGGGSDPTKPTNPTNPTTPTTPNEPGGNVPTDKITDDPFGVLDASDDLPFGLLPATGTSWWLVPILACAGVLLFLTGLYRNRRAGAGDEK